METLNWILLGIFLVIAVWKLVQAHLAARRDKAARGTEPRSD